MPRLFFALILVELPDDPTRPPRRLAAMGVVDGPAEPTTIEVSTHDEAPEEPRPGPPPPA